MQTNEAGIKGEYTGSYDALAKIYQKYGLSGVYRGVGITLLRESISYGAWFGCYGTLKELTVPQGTNPSILWCMFLGAIAGECFWLSTYPIDVWKTKLQSDSFTNPKYRGILDVFSQTYKTEGFIGFWRGIVPWLSRAPIASGTTFATFELTKKLITSDSE